MQDFSLYMLEVLNRLLDNEKQMKEVQPISINGYGFLVRSFIPVPHKIQEDPVSKFLSDHEKEMVHIFRGIHKFTVLYPDDCSSLPLLQDDKFRMLSMERKKDFLRFIILTLDELNLDYYHVLAFCNYIRQSKDGL